MDGLECNKALLSTPQTSGAGVSIIIASGPEDILNTHCNSLNSKTFAIFS